MGNALSFCFRFSLQFAQVVGRLEKLRKASYNTRVTNIFRKRASKLISSDSYMCELRRFFSFYPAAYLATKFLILMEFLCSSASGTRYVYAPKAILKFYVAFLN